jgi:AraC-like DNA-binding protein
MHRRDHDLASRTRDLPPAASFSTDGIPATDRLTFFRDAFLQTVTPAEVYGDPDPEFSARMKMDEFGMVTLTGVVTGSRRRRGLRRTPELIRRCDPRGYRLVLYQQGGATLAHNHHRIRLTPGDMTLVDTSRPYDGWDAAGSSRFLSVEFPRGLLPLRDSVDRLCGARLSGRSGVGALVWAFTTRLAQDIGHYRPPDAMRVSTTLLELMSAAFARELDVEEALPAESHRQALFRRVQVFIEQHLGDPALAPSIIAEAHHISLRTLHRLFESNGVTVADWLRTRRLSHCRRDLADPSLHERSIHAIAAHWGLPTAAHFTRIFRAAYGLSPQDYRASTRNVNQVAPNINDSSPLPIPHSGACDDHSQDTGSALSGMPSSRRH